MWLKLGGGQLPPHLLGSTHPGEIADLADRYLHLDNIKERAARLKTNKQGMLPSFQRESLL